MPKMKGYSVQYKLNVLTWYFENGKSLHKTSKEFKIDRKRIREWLAMEDALRGNSKGKASERKKLHIGKLSEVMYAKAIKCFFSHIFSFLRPPN